MQRYPFKRGVSNTHLTLAQEIQPLDTSRHSVSLNVTKVRGHLRMLYEFLGSITGRNSAVGTANNCRLGWQKEEISGRDFSFLQNHPDEVRGPSSLLFDGYRGSFPGAKWTGREVNHTSM